MTNKQKLETIAALSNDLKDLLEDCNRRLKLSEGVGIEALIYTLFSLLDAKIKEGIISKKNIEKLLKQSLNSYLMNTNMDLYINDLEYPSRTDLN
jgi:hypothetical protein